MASRFSSMLVKTMMELQTRRQKSSLFGSKPEASLPVICLSGVVASLLVLWRWLRRATCFWQRSCAETMKSGR